MKKSLLPKAEGELTEELLFVLLSPDKERPGIVETLFGEGERGGDDDDVTIKEGMLSESGVTKIVGASSSSGVTITGGVDWIEGGVGAKLTFCLVGVLNLLDVCGIL